MRWKSSRFFCGTMIVCQGIIFWWAFYSFQHNTDHNIASSTRFISVNIFKTLYSSSIWASYLVGKLFRWVQSSLRCQKSLSSLLNKSICAALFWSLNISSLMGNVGTEWVLRVLETDYVPLAVSVSSIHCLVNLCIFVLNRFISAFWKRTCLRLPTW